MAEQTQEHSNPTDLEAHEKTFEGFIKICAIFTLHVFAILIFLAIIGT